jgi:hypothetical protein
MKKHLASAGPGIGIIASGRDGSKKAPPGEPEQGFSFNAHSALGHRGAESCPGLGTRH